MNDFDTFIAQLKKTNQTLDFFCDFKKIEEQVNQIRLSLCMLNSLLGATNLRTAVETIWQRDKTAFQVMDILVAVRSGGKKFVLNSSHQCIILDTLFESVDGIMEYLHQTGLADLFQQKKINDLVDYVFGIETGLDTNARKNRGGHIMEAMVASIFRQAGIAFRQEVYSSEWEAITHVLGDDTKRFDFVIERPQKTYLVEVNFYSSGGSKLNEVARSYSELAPKINAIDGFEFVWITDGVGWLNAKNKLQEAYSIIPSIYNLTTLNEWIDSIKQ